jgi:hypothetical protein
VTEIRVRDPLVGWQEIDEADPGDEHEDITDLFGEPAHGTLARSFMLADGKPAGYTHAGFNQATPVSVPAPLAVTRTVVTQTCPGRSRTDARKAGTAATPHRVCVQALIDVPGLPDWPGWWHDNGHLPFQVPDLAAHAAGAWRHVVNEQQRDGRLIITTRDTNTHGPGPSIDPLGVTLTRPVDLIDKIVVVPTTPASSRRLTYEVLDRHDVNLTIDGHNAKGILTRITNPHTGDAVIVWVVTCNIGRKGDAAKARANIALVRRGYRGR